MQMLKRILVPLDFGAPSVRALDHAKVLAERFEASLDLLHVVPNPYLDDPAGLYLPLPEPYLEELVKDAQKRLNEILPSFNRQRSNVRTIVSVSNSLSGDHWKLNEVPAMGDPAHMAQIGRGNCMSTGEGQRRVAVQ